jgi:predicted RNA binding protein with dsRBD fold (UPF0201 family)
MCENSRYVSLMLIIANQVAYMSSMLPNLVNESDNTVRGLEIVVFKDDKKYEEHIDYNRPFTTNKVYTYPEHYTLYLVSSIL